MFGERAGKTPSFLGLITDKLHIAVPVESVRHVVRAQHITPVPLTRAGVLGVLVLDSMAVPVYRLSGLTLPTEQRESDPGNRGVAAGPEQIVVIEQDGAVAGFLVSQTEVIRRARPRGIPTIDGRTILNAAGVLNAGPSAAQTAQGER